MPDKDTIPTDSTKAGISHWTLNASKAHDARIATVKGFVEGLQ